MHDAPPAKMVSTRTELLRYNLRPLMPTTLNSPFDNSPSVIGKIYSEFLLVYTRFQVSENLEGNIQMKKHSNDSTQDYSVPRSCSGFVDVIVSRQ